MNRLDEEKKTLLDTVIEYYLIGAAVVWAAYVVGFWMRG